MNQSLNIPLLLLKQGLLIIFNWFIRSPTSQSKNEWPAALFASVVVMPFLLLAASPAKAADYSFPGNLPAGCVDNGSGNYTCSDLTLAAGDTLTIASATAIKVNGAFTVGANARVNAAGNFPLTIEARGAIGVGADTVFNANITSTEGAITIGARVQVGGAVKTLTAAISIGADSKIIGDISANDGAVSVGAGVALTGSINVTGTGAVTAGAGAVINGNISTSNGAIALGESTQVAGNLSTVTGAITLGANIDVNGNITTGTGDVTAGAASKIGGSISVTGSGSVTLGENSNVGGTISTANGSVTTGGGTQVGTALGIFECLETTSNRPWSQTTRRPLYTKLAGTDFKFDIAALKQDGTLDTGYPASKVVTVELFEDTTPLTNCTDFSGMTPVATQLIGFASGTSGRVLSNSFSLGSVAYPRLRCRVRECVDSTCSRHTSAPPSCSSDQFAVRPKTIILSTSASASPPSANSIPVIKAGSNFLLNATTAGIVYSGSLNLDKGKLTAQTSAQDTVSQKGGMVGTLTPSSLAANIQANATYSEAGYVYLAPGAYRDDTFTLVDSVTGDCITDTGGDNNLSDTMIDGKYGCSIGNQTPVVFGRFVPHHFSVVNPKLTDRCTKNMPFSYLGQDGFTTEFTLMALNALNEVTQNYVGVFAKMDPTNYLSYGFSAAPLPVGSNLAGSATPPSGNWSNGVASVVVKHQISRPATPTVETLVTLAAAPFDADVRAGAVSAVGSATRLRYGRLQMKNAYGSELLALPVPLEAQYLSAGGYVTNTDDSCTVIPTSSIAMGNYGSQLSACKTQISPAGNVALLAGKLPGTGLTLSRPGTGNAGSVDLTLNVSTTPMGTTCVGTTGAAATAANMPWFGASPGARATFGIYKSPLIFQRENY